VIAQAASVPAPGRPPAGQWSRSSTARGAGVGNGSGSGAVPTPVPRERTAPGVVPASSAPVAAPAPAAPAPAAPAMAAPSTPDPAKTPAGAARRGRRRGEQSITDAFATIQDAASGAANGAGTPTTSGVSSQADLAAVRGVFDEIAAVHVTQVRNVMLELRFGDVECSWVESSRPALTSLRTMAARMELADLTAALVAAGLRIETIMPTQRLEDAFLELLEAGDAGAAGAVSAPPSAEVTP